MPVFNVCFFLIHKPRPPLSGSSGPGGSGSPIEDLPEFRDFLSRYTSRLTDMFERSIPHTPGYVAPSPSDAPASSGSSAGLWTVNVQRVPEAGPGVPDFSGLTIGPRDPIVYLSGGNHSAGSAVNRRASYVMLDAFSQGNFPGTPPSYISSWRSQLSAGGDVGGMAMIPWDTSSMTETVRFAPLVPEVFANLTPMTAPDIFAHMTIGELRSRWAEVMAGFLANASFHEIAHCKAECYNRQAPTQAGGSASTPWHSTRSSSIHDVSGARILAAEVAWNTSPSDADLQTMGHHMLCPMPFYKLDEPVGPQCYDRGTPHPLTPGPPPAEEEELDLDTLDI